MTARPRGLLTDIDGTISAIAPTPEAATLLPGMARLLARASASFDVVVAVSGRAAPDALKMVGLPELIYVGNHGLEWIDPRASGAVRVLPTAQPYAGAIAAVLDTIERAIAPSLPGVRIERKGVTGSVHYRGASDPDAAERAILDAARPLAERHGLRVTQGKMVVELRPPLMVDKGTTVERLTREFGLRGAIYLGDDRTDCDAFRALRRLNEISACLGIAVGVAHDEAPACLITDTDIVLPSIDDVPRLLRRLLRMASSLAGAS